MQRVEALRILREHWPELQQLGVQTIAVFGSVARDEATPGSDVDILIELQPDLHIGFFKFFRIKEYLEQILATEVDLVEKEALKPQLREGILREAVRAA
ncbi:MAG TPA: nucleotidyltransferase family protein [Chroococcales cyanobacterium]|jgi:hypothetical protein